MPTRNRKLIIVVPSRKFKFSGIYNVSEDLHTGLENEKIEHEMVLVVTSKKYAEPEFSTNKVALANLSGIFSSEKIFIIPDDYILINHLHSNKIYNQNVIIWSHYFKGHRLLFSEYINRPREKTFFDFGSKLSHDFLPYAIWKFFFHDYVRYLKNNVLISQSVWSCLLLNRVYGLNCQSIIPLPIDRNYFRVNQASDKKCLIFIGGKQDTDLNKLDHVLTIINDIDPKIKYYAIGDRQTCDHFVQTFRHDLIFKQNVSRSDLQDLIARMTFTINPIYIGTFEMFPIESLMCGTPTITFIQPFLEVTGTSKMISSIHSDSDVKNKVKDWLLGNIGDERERIKKLIIDRMWNNRIARDIFQLARDEFP